MHVGFDGVPYRIATDLIENMKQCTICSALVDLKVETEDEHHEECHPEEENIVLKKALSRMMLTCGAGDMEKNLLLATFKFCKVNVKIDSFRVVRGTKISLAFSYSSANSLNISLNVFKKKYEVTFSMNRGLKKISFPFI